MIKSIKSYKYILIGKLLKIKFDYAKFKGIEITPGGPIEYTFINKEGFPRYHCTSKRRILTWLQYTEHDILDVLFKSDPIDKDSFAYKLYKEFNF